MSAFKRCKTCGGFVTIDSECMCSLQNYFVAVEYAKRFPVAWAEKSVERIKSEKIISMPESWKVFFKK